MAKIPKFKRTQPGADPKQDVTQLNNQLERILPKVSEVALIDGVLTEEIQITFGTTYEHPHGLGRAYKGFIVVSSDSDHHVFLDTDSTADTTKYIALKIGSIGYINVKLWIF